MATLKYWLWLTGRRGLGNAGALRVLDHFVTPERAFYADPEEYALVEDLTPAARRALLDQQVGALAHGGVDVPWHGKQVPVLLQRPVHRDHSAAVRAAFHRHYPQAQAAEDAVAHREVLPPVLRPRRVLGDEGPGGGHVLIEPAVLPGVGYIHSAPQHRHHRSAALQSALDAGRIDTLGHARHHQGPAPGQLQAEPPRRADPIGGGLPCPHHAHRRLLVEGEGPAPDVQR